MSHPTIVLVVLLAAPVVLASTTQPATPPVVITIRTAAGTPAGGAVVVVVPRDHTVSITDGEQIDDDAPGCPRATAGPDGVVHLPALPPPPFVVALVHPDGYTQLDSPTSEHLQRVRLSAWARVDGRLMIGKHPGAGEAVRVWPEDDDDQPYDSHKPAVYHELEVKTDADGHFVFPRVPPGLTGAGRLIRWQLPQGDAGGYTQKQKFTVAPGASGTITIGGVGRRIEGRALLPLELANRTDWRFGICNVATRENPPPPPMPDDVRRASPREQQAWYDRFTETDAGRAYLAANEKRMGNHLMYPLEMSRDGTFHIDDVAAGSFNARVDVIRTSTDGAHKPGERIATGSLDFDVPTTPADAGAGDDPPVTIADVKVAMIGPSLQPGDATPDFTVKTIDGDELKLSEFRGKFVLLDFWATWCGPCVAQTDYLKDIYDTFGKDGRLVMIGLSSDDQPFEAKQYADRHGLAYHQCHLGRTSAIANDYGVSGIPSIWLIGPDGRVVQKYLREKGIKAAVAKVLTP